MDSMPGQNLDSTNQRGARERPHYLIKRDMTMKKKTLNLKLANAALMLFVMGAWVWFITIVFYALTDV